MGEHPNIYVSFPQNCGTQKMEYLQWKTQFFMDDLGGTTILGNTHMFVDTVDGRNPAPPGMYTTL